MQTRTDKRVRDVLGADRVKSVDVHVKTNFDGMEILRVAVVYANRQALTVDDMTRVTEALISDMASADAPFPVIDFISDEDHAPIAAE
jgi:hypothetical protein